MHIATCSIGKSPIFYQRFLRMPREPTFMRPNLDVRPSGAFFQALLELVYRDDLVQVSRHHRENECLVHGLSFLLPETIWIILVLYNVSTEKIFEIEIEGGGFRDSISWSSQGSSLAAGTWRKGVEIVSLKSPGSISS